MQLILTEKPSVANNIAYALNVKNRYDGYYEGNGYIVTFAFGHLFELYDTKDYKDGFEKWELDKFPFIPEKFRYKVKEDKGVKKQVKIIKELASKEEVKEIIIATDADREGQLIAAIIIKELNINKPMKRLWINSYTSKEVHQGMKNLLDYKDVLTLEKAGYCRQQMDWLFGINFTSLATLKYSNGKLLNVGRVILPTVKLVYDRNIEIKNFKKETYYQLKCIFNTKDGQYEGYFIDDGIDRFKVRKKLENILDAIRNKHGIIIERKTKEVKESAPLLYNLTDLQGDITSRYNSFTSDKVLSIAQSLYEKRYISYPRTSSRHLDNTQDKEVEEVLNVLSNDYPSEYNIKFHKSKRIFDSTKVDSHPAIIPTYIKPNSNDLTKDELLVYEVIKKRFLAHFMPQNEYLDIKVITEVKGCKFLSKCRNLIKKGWLKLYDNKDIDKKIDTVLLKLKEADIVEVIHSGILEKETQPPKLYTEKTLLKAMENCGKKVKDEDIEHILKGYSIGTPATRSDVIKKIIGVGYIKKKGKSLDITDLGRNLVKVFPIKELLNTDFTGRIEKSLKDIEKGVVNPDLFMERMIGYTEKSSNIIKGSNGTIYGGQDNTNKVIGKCPECGHDVIEGKKAYGCSNWRNGCKFTIWYNQLEKLGMRKISKTNIKKLLKNELINLKLRSAKTGKDFTCKGKLEKEKDKWGIKLVF